MARKPQIKKNSGPNKGLAILPTDKGISRQLLSMLNEQSAGYILVSFDANGNPSVHMHADTVTARLGQIKFASTYLCKLDEMHDEKLGRWLEKQEGLRPNDDNDRLMFPKIARFLLLIITCLYLTGCYSLSLYYATPKGEQMGVTFDRRTLKNPTGFSKELPNDKGFRK